MTWLFLTAVEHSYQGEVVELGVYFFFRLKKTISTVYRYKKKALFAFNVSDLGQMAKHLP